MSSGFVISIDDPEVCRQVAELMLARGVRTIDRPPTIRSSSKTLLERLEEVAERRGVVTIERRLSEQVAERLNAAVPDQIHILVPPGAADFVIFSGDHWWGTQGFGVQAAFQPGSSPAELADQLETALSGIQDIVVHAIEGAWPDLEDGELPLPWTRIVGDELRFGFGEGVVLPPIPVTALTSSE